MARRLRLLVMAFACVVTTLMQAERVWACTPPPGGFVPSTIAERTAQADHVIAGTVLVVEDGAPYAYSYSATLGISETLKGTLAPTTIWVDGYGPSSLCQSEVSVGDRLIFFVRGQPGALQASYVGAFSAVVDLTPAALAEVRVAVNMRARAWLPMLLRN